MLMPLAPSDEPSRWSRLKAGDLTAFGVSYDEIADLMAISYQGVVNLIYKAMVRLRQQFLLDVTAVFWTGVAASGWMTWAQFLLLVSRAWRENRWQLQGEPLVDVAIQLEETYGVQVLFRHEADRKRTITGNVPNAGR